jgi:hypothetical protein
MAAISRSFCLHDLLAPAVPRGGKGIDERLAGRQLGCHRVVGLSREPLQVAKRVEHRADAEQT